MPLDAGVALVGLAGVAVGAAVQILTAKRNNQANRALAEQRLDADYRLQREKLDAEHGLRLKATETIRSLLLTPEYKLRSFEAIQKKVRGFSDNELRQLLVGAGAVSFEERDTGRELWGLTERNGPEVRPPRGAPQFDPEPAQVGSVHAPGSSPRPSGGPSPGGGSSGGGLSLPGAGSPGGPLRL